MATGKHPPGKRGSRVGILKSKPELKPEPNPNRLNYRFIRVLVFDSFPINAIFRGMSSGSIPNL
jgi:hypothetical protein